MTPETPPQAMTISAATATRQTAARPLLKWAGGKKQLLGEIERRLPADFSLSYDTYVEPFVGGGSVAFHLLQHYENIRRAVICDINPRLINLYSVVKTAPEALIDELEKLQNQYIPLSHDDRTELYLTQRQLFNSATPEGVEQAARLVFLNRTCFNGLYRENSKGGFNVPHGRYANPAICDPANIMAVSRLLQRVEIKCGDFSSTRQYASPTTLFYFDPPYKPLSATSSFNSYVKDEFGDSEQIRLHDFCDEVSRIGSAFILSNSDPHCVDAQNDFFDRLYADYTIDRVTATRMINANPNGRGQLSELMITNT